MMARLLLPVKAFLFVLLMCLALRVTMAQSCQTLTLTNLQPAGGSQDIFGFSLQYAGGPLDEFSSLYTDDVIYISPQASTTFDLASIFQNIGNPTGFPKGPYTLTVSLQSNGDDDSAGVQVSVGSGLSLQNGSAQTVQLTSAAPAVYLPLNNLQTFCNAYLPQPIQVLDPRPLGLTNPANNLMSMSGTSVTSDRSKLATGGRPVQGIVADGSAEIVFRIPVQTAGDMITATILSDTCEVASIPASCAASSNNQYDGYLFTLSVNSPALNSEKVAAIHPRSRHSERNPIVGNDQSTPADANGFAYLVYVAPVDFVRQFGFPDDPTDPFRQIQIRVLYTSSDGTNYALQYVPLPIIRPPTILIHGYASSSAETWKHFALVTDDTRTVTPVDYSGDITVAYTTPPLGCIRGSEPICDTFRESDLGFTYNTPQIASQILDVIQDFAAGNNPLTYLAGGNQSVPVALSQVDIVAHSMGGLIARYWSTDPADALPYFSPNNFSQGYIHKLITLGTPHYGTPFATESLSDDADCFRTTGTGAPRYIIGTATFSDGYTVNGAVGELSGDGIGLHLNTSLQAIQTSAQLLPMYTIAGSLTSAGGTFLAGIHTLCGSIFRNPNGEPDPVASRMTPDLFNTLFDPGLNPTTELNPSQPEPNDGVVPVTSAFLNSGCGFGGGYCFSGDAHGGGTALLVGANKNLVDGTGDVAALVKQVLNTSIEDTDVWIQR